MFNKLSCFLSELSYSERIEFMLGGLCGMFCCYCTLCYLEKKLKKKHDNDEQNQKNVNDKA